MNLIEKVKEKTGKLIRIWSTEKSKKNKSQPWYISTWVEDEKGENGKCLLFTPKEIEIAEERSKQNLPEFKNHDFFDNLTN